MQALVRLLSFVTAIAQLVAKVHLAKLEIRVKSPWHCSTTQSSQNKLIATGEFIAAQRISGFWKFMDAVHQTDDKDNEWLGDQVKRLLSLDALSQWQEQLNIKAFTPRLAAFMELAVEPPANCRRLFVQINEQVYCPEQAKAIVTNGISKNKDPTTLGTNSILEIDHVFAHHYEQPIAIIYSSYEKNDQYEELSMVLKQKADLGELSLLFRPIIDKTQDTDELSGFGIQFEIKEEIGKSKILKRDVAGLEAFENKSFELVLKPEESQYKHLGMQMTQAVINSAAPLSTLTTISQNLAYVMDEPIRIEESLHKQASTLHQLFTPDLDYIFINRFVARPEALNLYSLMELGNLYTRNMNAAPKEISPSQFIQSIASGFSVEPVRYLVKSDSIIYLNDLKLDTRYSHWSNTVFSLMRQPTNQQGFYQIRRNLITAVLAIDLSDKENAGKLVEVVLEWVKAEVPIRFGIIPVNPTEDSEINEAIKAFYGILVKYGSSKAMGFLEGFVEHIADMKALYGEITKDLDQRLDFEAIIDLDIARVRWIGSCEFLRQFDTAGSTLFINGRVWPLIPFQKAMITAYREEIRAIQMFLLDKSQVSKVQEGQRVSDAVLTKLDKDMETYYEDILLKGNGHKSMLVLPQRKAAFTDDGKQVSSIRVDELRDDVVDSLINPNTYYAVPPKRSKAIDDFFLLWVVADPLTPEGLRVIKEVLKFIGTTKEVMRFRWFFPNTGEKGRRIAKFYNDLLLNRIDLAHVNPQLEDLKSPISRYPDPFDTNSPERAAKKQRMEDHITNVYGIQSKLVKILLKGKEYERPLIFLNGNRFEPTMNNVDAFKAQDLSIWIQMERHWRTNRHYELLKQSNVKPISADLLFRMASIENSLFNFLESDCSSTLTLSTLPDLDGHRLKPTFEIGASITKAKIHIEAFINPLSSVTQKLSSLLTVTFDY